MVMKYPAIIISAIATFAMFQVSNANSQSPSEQDIIKALTKPPVTSDEFSSTRSLTDKRGVSVTEGEEKIPSIDLKVNFEFDSDNLENEAILTLHTLGRALTNEKLENQYFEVIGHTDAAGSYEYNDGLSQRRAAAVVRFLVLNFSLDRSLISSRGMGERQLLDEFDPENEINRRVEIRNVTMTQ